MSPKYEKGGFAHAIEDKVYPGKYYILLTPRGPLFKKIAKLEEGRVYCEAFNIDPISINETEIERSFRMIAFTEYLN